MEKVFGRHPVLEILKAHNRKIHKIFLNAGSQGRVIEEIRALAESYKIPIYKKNKKTLNNLSGYKNHQGVIAFTDAQKYFDLDDLFHVAEINREPPFFLILDRVKDPHNLGAVIRSAESAGVHGIIIPKYHTVDVNETVAKSAAGALEYIKIVRVTNIAKTIDLLKSKNVWVFGVEQEKGKDIFAAEPFKESIALLLGEEGSGIRRLPKEKCDGFYKIPMFGYINSLNLSVAAAILMYQIRRFRDY